MFCFECVKITVVFFTHNRRNKMLKSIEFLRKKSRGEVEGDTKPTPLAPVILGLVPRIFWQQGHGYSSATACRVWRQV